MTGIIVEIEGIENADVLEFYTKNGKLMCDVEFTDNEVEWKRPVVVGGDTGISYGCGEMGGSVSCGGVTVGYKKVKDIPKNFGTNIYIGSVKRRVIGYEYITAEMVKELASYDVEQMEDVFAVDAGDRFVVAIPYDWDLTAYKDNGFGGKVTFSTSVMGANKMKLDIDGVAYKIYGEFITVGGDVKIYIR